MVNLEVDRSQIKKSEHIYLPEKVLWTEIKKKIDLSKIVSENNVVLCNLKIW